jgi:hypothetical protein
LKLIIRAFPIVFLFLLALATVPRAQAQSFSVSFGAGAATDKACVRPADCLDQQDINNPAQLDNAPKMTGAFGKIGADFMFTGHLGFGFQADWKFSQGDYFGFGYRPEFFDLNAIYHPIPDKLTRGRVVPEIQVGLGAARVNSYLTGSTALTGTQSELFAISSHFLVHGGFGVKLYVKGGIFIKPQVDARYVVNFTQFGSDFVPEYSVSLGYTFGRR